VVRINREHNYFGTNNNSPVFLFPISAWFGIPIPSGGFLYSKSGFFACSHSLSKVNLVSGILYIGVGLIFWRRAISDVPKSSWLYSFIMRADTVAIAVLCTFSLIMTFLSFPYGNRFAPLCFSISLITTILSATIVVWRYYEPTPRAIYLHSQPEFSLTKVEYDDTLKYSTGRMFRFSKLKDPSEVIGLVNPSRAEEIPAKGKSGPEFRMSKLEGDPIERVDGE
jgi:hypothetical protein